MTKKKKNKTQLDDGKSCAKPVCWDHLIDGMLVTVCVHQQHLFIFCWGGILHARLSEINS